MTPLRRRVRSSCLAAIAVVASVAATGCSDDKVNISPATEKVNEVLAGRDVKVDCPDKVANSSEPFDCVVTGTKTGRTSTAKFKLTGEERDTLDADSQEGLEKAITDATSER